MFKNKEVQKESLEPKEKVYAKPLYLRPKGQLGYSQCKTTSP